MPLSAPHLDDRTFDDLVAEARRRIPRHTPEWTDHNATDPGITFLELYAWLTEMALFRLNQVPDRLYVKFLEMLGVQLASARPARAGLTFTVARDDVDAVIVPRATPVAAPAEDGGDAVIFETDQSLVAISARLAAVQSFDGFGYTLETQANDGDEQSFAPFGTHAREGSALVLGFASPLPMTAQPIRLTIELEPPRTGRPQRRCDGEPCGAELGAEVPPGEITWEYWDGADWRFLTVDADDTRGFSRSGTVTVRGPGPRAVAAPLGRVTGESLYWLRGRLVRSGFDRPPRLTTVRLNTITATQGQTVTDEILGGSDGRPDQTFQLANPPVLEIDHPLPAGATVAAEESADGRAFDVDRLRLEVNEGATDDDFRVWRRVDDFFASGPDDPHFVLDATTGQVRFGDGHRGRIPLANPDFPTNVVARFYRFGGGRRGNVGPGAVSQLQSYVEGISAVTNPRPALGGSDEETLDEARNRAVGDLKARHRAVTAEDFEHLALATPGVRVRRAAALPRTHPSFPGACVPGSVTVVVVPDQEGPRPMPADETLANVCRHLDRHRLLTTELHVVAPTYHEIQVRADIIARADADLAQVQRGVTETLETYFHALTGGEEGTGWGFGDDVFYSRVYRRLLEVEGVDRVRDNQLELWLDGEVQPFCRDVPVTRGALLHSAEHRITVAYSTEDRP